MVLLERQAMPVQLAVPVIQDRLGALVQPDLLALPEQRGFPD